MAGYVTRIRTEDGIDRQIDYNSLANLPKVFTEEEIKAFIDAQLKEVFVASLTTKY